MHYFLIGWWRVVVGFLLRTVDAKGEVVLCLAEAVLEAFQRSRS